MPQRNLQKLTPLTNIVIIAFYKFAHIDNCAELKAKIKDCMINNDIKGTILLAPEGINSTVSGSREGVDNLLFFLKSDARLHDLKHKEAYFHKQVFRRAKVKVKKELITLGVQVDPNKKVGTYVSSKEWNNLLSDPEIILIDTRNKYEVELGTFEGAINPETQTFRDFPHFTSECFKDAKKKKIAMYCTGGIRCEKYSSYMLEQGFEKVFHLDGGILQYLEDIPEVDSKWKGDCFVFDERITVNHSDYKRFKERLI